MTRNELLAIFAKHGLTVDCERITTGTEKAGFRTFEVGTSAGFDKLLAAKKEIKEHCRYTYLLYVDNNEHPQYNQPFLSVESFWCASHN